MNRKHAPCAPLAALTLIAALAGCTTEAWYEGVKQSAANRCESQPPGERQRCLDELNKKPYAEYEKERSGQKP